MQSMLARAPRGVGPARHGASTIALPRPAGTPRAAPASIARPPARAVLMHSADPSAAVQRATYAELESMVIDLSAFPNCNFFEIGAVVRPWRSSFVIESLSKAGVRGLTVTQVKGVGMQGGSRERYAGTEYSEVEPLDKVRIDVVVNREQAQFVCRCVAAAAYTGEIGDGKIFVYPVADVIRIRTAETGGVAERMQGGMADMLSKNK